jgi:hypothetical protein
MKRVIFGILMSAALATATLPAFAPVVEAAPGEKRPQQLLQSAQRNQGVVLTAAQWAQLEKSHPRIAKEVIAARAQFRVPVLTPGERKVLLTMSKATLAKIHAGAKKTQVTVTPSWMALAGGLTSEAVTKAWGTCTGALSFTAAIPAPWGQIVGIGICVLVFIPLVIAAFALLLTSSATAKP